MEDQGDRVRVFNTLEKGEIQEWSYKSHQRVGVITFYKGGGLPL
mgnify:CR=1 FL=1